jgi:hypothetical protein
LNQLRVISTTSILPNKLLIITKVFF